MATAVLDIDVANLPPKVTGLEQYTHALILIRLRGRPVGQASLPVIKGRIGGTELHDTVMEAAGWPLWNRWMEDYLAWDERSGPNYVPPKATVAVCTRDRPDDLRRCLDSVMKLPDDGQQVLVVDNCPSSEATRWVVEEYPGVDYTRENLPGLNFARNRALREAQHEVVAFIDDDAVPDPNWLRALLRNFDDPLVRCVTGLVMPLELETPAQEGFERHCPFGRGFVRRVFDGEGGNPLAVGQIGAGASMALQKKLVQEIGTFDEALDCGTPTHSGGETDMFSRILTAGYKIVYEPHALSWHCHRRTWSKLRQTIYGYGVGAYAYVTRQFLFEREFTALKIPWGWFWHDQVPGLFRSVLRKPGSKPLGLILVELLGCAVGPWAYLYSRARARTMREGT